MRKLTGPILLVGTPANSTDLEYATGFHTADTVVFAKHQDKRYLVVSRLEYRRAVRTDRSLQVFTPEMLDLASHVPGDLSKWAIALLRKLKISRVTVPGVFPVEIALAVQRAGIKLTCCHEPIWPERTIKTKNEIRRITEAQQAAVIAMRAAVDLISRTEIDERGFIRLRGDRLTSEEVKRAVRHVLLDHDCFCRDVIVACGEMGADAHETGSGPLRAAEPIVIDIFPQHLAHGYWGDLTRTIVRGRASVQLRRMYSAVRAAHAAALAAVRPGVKGSTVQQAVELQIRRRGFKPAIAAKAPSGFIHSTGHGIGLSLHEEPRIGFEESRLRAGNVIAIEPGLYYPQIGCVRIEDTVLVTSDGWRYLVPCERRLEV